MIRNLVSLDDTHLHVWRGQEQEAEGRPQRVGFRDKGEADEIAEEMDTSIASFVRSCRSLQHLGVCSLGIGSRPFPARTRNALLVAVSSSPVRKVSLELFTTPAAFDIAADIIDGCCGASEIAMHTVKWRWYDVGALRRSQSRMSAALYSHQNCRSVSLHGIVPLLPPEAIPNLWLTNFRAHRDISRSVARPILSASANTLTSLVLTAKTLGELGMPQGALPHLFVLSVGLLKEPFDPAPMATFVPALGLEVLFFNGNFSAMLARDLLLGNLFPALKGIIVSDQEDDDLTDELVELCDSKHIWLELDDDEPLSHPPSDGEGTDEPINANELSDDGHDEELNGDDADGGGEVSEGAEGESSVSGEDESSDEEKEHDGPTQTAGA